MTLWVDWGGLILDSASSSMVSIPPFMYENLQLFITLSLFRSLTWTHQETEMRLNLDIAIRDKHTVSAAMSWEPHFHLFQCDNIFYFINSLISVCLNASLISALVYERWLWPLDLINTRDFTIKWIDLNKIFSSFTWTLRTITLIESVHLHSSRSLEVF